MSVSALSFWEVFGIFGSVASIISLLISAPGLKSKLIHISYSLIMIGMLTWFMSYQHNVQQSLAELERIKKIEKQADFLTGYVDLSTAGNMAGYSQAVLAFLEKNRDLYPDTYERAKKLCEQAGCTKSEFIDGERNYNHFSKMQQASSAMKMLVKGVSSMGGK